MRIKRKREADRHVPPPECRGLIDGVAIHPSSASPGRDQSQPGGAIPTGLRYQEVPEFVPTGDVPACSSTTSGLNRETEYERKQ